MDDQEINSGASTTTPDRERALERAGSTTSFHRGDHHVVGTPDVHEAGIKIQRAKSAYEAYAGHEEKPTKVEVFGWCFYGLCSYFIHTVLIPIVFPLIISQIASPMPDDITQRNIKVMNGKGYICTHKEMLLYNRLTNRTITVHNAKYTPLEWTSISWAVGLALAAPLLGLVSTPLDRGPHQSVIALVATVVGATFCLPAGFFRTVWIFPPYIAAIVAASTIPAAYHTRHLGMMIRGFTSPNLRRSQFPLRRAAGGWLSLAAAATGSLGSAVISSFAFHMLREKEEFVSLWIVSIFSGIKWLLGSLHFVTSNRISLAVTPASRSNHAFSILKFPHAVGSLASAFLSSVSTMSVFTGAVLYLVGDLCFRPNSLLYFWLSYFLFPLFSLPILHPIQHLLRANAVKMQILGFFLTAATSGVGFAYRFRDWKAHQALVFAAVQGTSNGLLHAFSRVLLMDCAPRGKEGAFSTWFVWIKFLGSLVGFAIASAHPRNVAVSFGLGFCTAIAAVVVLIFGNVSDLGGALAAGHVKDYDVVNEDRDRGSPVSGVDDGVEVKQPVQEMP
ncbi:Major facilitator superfamily domain containing protein [Parasponia andersonii]|uniref:Major facilitator superfamily domain containing protein n=1 Tax=Parasponia andersonii TaxID=3476 RepID=A0A2P5AZ65_PARAD|nr:Major facilitator superfamily domain containing protein [Parasponia andersonii]